MAMSVQTNMTAMFASRYAGIQTNKISKNTEKLSSGFKINRAADNAAGLAISEKLRRQIRGLGQGTTNAQEGVSLCQVADGALSEVSDMLHRMTELSIQASNDTLTSDDRMYIQEEIKAIQAEISRVGVTTTYNERPIFDDIIGTPKYRDVNLVSSPAADDGNMTESYKAPDGTYRPAASLDFSKVNEDNIHLLDGKSFTFTCSAACDEAFKITFDYSIPYSKSSASNLTGQVQHDYVLGIKGLSDGTDVVGKIFSLVKNHMPNGMAPGSSGDLAVSHSNVMTRTAPDKIVIYSSVKRFSTKKAAENCYKGNTDPYGKVHSSDLTGITYKEEIRDLWIQSGSEGGNGLYLTIPRMNADVIGVGSVDASTAEGARDGINKIKKALGVISKARSDIGAQQNALEHTVNNNNATVENTEAAESRIRDTDMAKEMVSLSINNILQQSTQTMMAQANQSAEGILSLLS
ncbi:MAG: flagellin [Lachnospiraceae bacterium]|nr:flagellin [Lachnospiraceae bacterium]